MTGKSTAGHFSALLTIIIWGTTFISTKILLADFQPVEILFFRFVIGAGALLLVYPRRLKGTKHQELIFAAAGLCGICLYYLLENIALTCTMASNVGVIISVAPFFTAILSYLFLKEEKPRASFFIGFAAAMTGIALISFNDSRLKLKSTGDLLALLAALIWACYSVLTKIISGYGYHTILTTRRSFCYGILFMFPACSCSTSNWNRQDLQIPCPCSTFCFWGWGHQPCALSLGILRSRRWERSRRALTSTWFRGYSP